MSLALSVQNLVKGYDSGTQALKGLDLEVNDGEFFGLLGPNGAGKSTLINIISGPTKLSSGKIEVYGVDIMKNPEEAKMMIGVVPQEISFDSFFTVNETLQLQSGYYGIRNNQKHIDEILERLSLSDKKNSKPRALSGGMKRRLLIAKALVHKPKLLILDEPTAGVDVELRHLLWNYVQDLNQQGLTILLTTHYLEEAENLCKRIGIINHGELVALDETKKLIRSLGDRKNLIVYLKSEIPELPASLQKFSPEIVNKNELHFNFSAETIKEILASLQGCNLEIIDLDMQSAKLEDVFVKLTYGAN